MSRLSSVIVFVCSLLLSAERLHAQAGPPPQPSAVLVTLGPGDQVWEKYGHNMLWLRDPARGIDRCYNWGLFDFDQPNFIGNFVQGRMLYTMDGYPPNDALAEYVENDRRALMQRLNLSPEQVGRLIDLCEDNRKPANRDYKYDYFRDNCSIRVRDMIDRASDGELRRLVDQTATPFPSYRQYALQLMQDDWFVATGIDLALGPATDRPLSAWEACFVPMELIPFAREMSASEIEPWNSARPPEPATVPRRWPRLTLLGVAIAAVMVGVSRWRRLNLLSLSLWWTLCSTAGGLLLFLWLCTDHWSAYRNQNLLHLSPIAFVCLLLLIARRARLAWRPAAVIVGVSVVGLLLRAVGVLGQDNLAFIGLSLPPNLAALYAARRLTPASPVDEVAPAP